VLQEALARDNVEQEKQRGNGISKKDALRSTSAFIQIIHKYRDSFVGNDNIPPERIAIFDEAQRSWTHKRLADYLKRGGTYGNKLKVPNFPLSEAAFLIWSLDQREDWATIVCLVGGGQEINTGEAGISEWINALNDIFSHWKVYISPKLTEPEYAEGKVNALLSKNKNVTYSDNLHLGVSLRSFRAEKLSAFVHSVLTFNPNAADLYREIKDRYYKKYGNRKKMAS
jgi:hypothetical protein